MTITAGIAPHRVDPRGNAQARASGEVDRVIVRPKDLDLDSPGRRDYLVALEHDNAWADHLIPLTVWVGPEAQPDRGLVATGSNHGNELEGPVALKKLLREIRLEDVRGRIILVPVLNPSAFASGTRTSVSDDGVNLNRAFVDGAGVDPAIAGITHRIAAFVRQQIWPRVHVVIDIHAAGDMFRFAPLASYHPIDDPEQGRAIAETARWFGTPMLLTYQNQTPGLLPSDAERLGKICVGAELGWLRSIDPEGLLYARQGILAAAINHGQLRGELEPIAHHRDGSQIRVEMVERACFTVAPVSGHFERAVTVGQRVRRGDALGWIHDFERIDDEPLAVLAEVDGAVIGHAWANPIKRGDHIVVVGTINA